LIVEFPEGKLVAELVSNSADQLEGAYRAGMLSGNLSHHPIARNRPAQQSNKDGLACH